MTIQIISNDRLSHFNNSDYVISPLRSPKSLDEFDLNIVDLSTESLWRNRSNNYSSINDIRDYISLRQMAERKTTSAVLFVYPQINISYIITTHISNMIMAISKKS